MDDLLGENAASVRERLSLGAVSPRSFRAALQSVEPSERDRWLDLVLGTGDIDTDGPELPRGCVPYLPCGVDAVLGAIDEAEVGSHDVFVDIGCGPGRTLALAHLVTGAAAVGVEIQPHLARAAGELARRLQLSSLHVIHADAGELGDWTTQGTVFFLYCPFGGARLEAVIDALEAPARARPIHVCSVDLPLPARAWLTPTSSEARRGNVRVYRSTPP